MTNATVLSVVRSLRRRMPAASVFTLAVAGYWSIAVASQATPEPQGKPVATSPAAPGPAPQQQTATQGTARIGDAGNVVRLAGGSAQVLLTMSGLGAAVDKLPGTALSELASTLAIGETQRLGPVAAHVVTVTRGAFVGRAGAGSLSWLVTVSAKDLPPDTLEKRMTTLSLGPEATRELYPLEFTLTNQPAAAVQFEVTAPGHDWMVSRSDGDTDRVYPLMIVNRSEPISGLRVSQVSLKRSDDGGSIPFDEVKLVPASTGAPGAIALQPNETRTVFLRLEPSTRLLPFGSFTGQVQLVSDGTAPKAVPLTARVSSGGVRLAGAALVLAGLLVSLFTTTRLQPRLARLQALRPATLLRDLVLAFVSESETAAPDDVAGIVAEAKAQAARLDTRALDAAGLLPLAINIAGGVTGTAATQLQSLLNDVSARFAGLMVLRDTVVQVVKAHPRANRSAAAQTAIDELNAAAPQATTAAAAQAAVATILATLRAALAAAPGAERETALTGPPPVTTQQLDFMLHQTANVAAAIWAAVSLAIGVTYVYSDVDFGTPVDLLGMFLWGLGLTAFGAGIQQLTPRQVATQIGVAVPRSGAAAAQG